MRRNKVQQQQLFYFFLNQMSDVGFYMQSHQMPNVRKMRVLEK